MESKTPLIHATIYKITSPATQQVYVGQTTKRNINCRFAEHKTNYWKFYKQGKGNYRSSYEILQYPDAKIEALETIECTNKTTLSAIERYYIDKEKSVNLVNRSHKPKIIS
jgi:hypothetical protein